MPQTHTIRSGDSLANIAYDNGLLIETIWEHADNAALRARRANMNILMPGDVVVIPDKRQGEVTAATDQRHRFRLKGVPHVFQVQLFDDDEPRSRQDYALQVDCAGQLRRLSGTTDDAGVLKAYIPPGATKARLLIEQSDDHERLELDILFGTLEPVDELSGVQQRLANLGFDCPVDGQPSDDTSAAIAAFQRQFGLAVTGEADAATRARLTAMNEEVSEFPPEPPEPA